MKHEILLSTPPVIRDFLVYNETIKGKSEKSIQEYFFDLQTFFRYILMVRGIADQNVEFDQISIDCVDLELIKTITVTDLYAFIVYCKNERNNGSAARARKVSTLRIFFKYLSSYLHLLENNPAEMLDSPKLKKSLPQYLSLEDSLELLSVVDGPYKERDFCILVFFLNCGMRLSELCNLNISDIYSDGSMKILGKGNKERIIYLNDACLEALKNYMAVRPNDGIKAEDRNALFISRTHRRISNKTVQHIVKKYLESAGLGDKGLSTHKLRHTAATLMYQHGNVDIRVLKDILGHASLGTTQIYTHVSNAQVKNAINSNPLANVKTKNCDKKED